ncbi:hypothetical protein ANCCAN_04123 [Ancylostoma caninum]|uniref:Uncharacterized protein n=1 Tax=Ancylostoma caninum TaxID=29170 RepID=A0A368H3P7_ANCCA|nr:hypothetical protein ANCCAN_04123 [Ancylostoma caninum]
MHSKGSVLLISYYRRTMRRPDGWHCRKIELMLIRVTKRRLSIKDEEPRDLLQLAHLYTNNNAVGLASHVRATFGSWHENGWGNDFFSS